MKKLLFLLCIFIITSCNDDVIEQAPENISGDISLRAASDVHPLDRSFTTPLWEYVTVRPTIWGFNDYYYLTGDNPNSTIRVNGADYQRVRLAGRIFKNNPGYPYNYSQNSGWSRPITIWYSPTMKRHRVIMGMPNSSANTILTAEFKDNYSACDYYQVGLLGYAPGYILPQDRSVYQKAGMLEYFDEVAPYNVHIINELDRFVFRIGSVLYFNQLGGWSGWNSIGYLYAN